MAERKTTPNQLNWESAIQQLKNDGFQAISIGDLEKFKPREGWFKTGGEKLHQGDHVSRVLVMCMLQVNLLPEAIRKNLDLEAIGWSAIVHDVARNGEDSDDKHGKRAAQWVSDNLADIVNPGTLEKIKYLCEWHVPDDKNAPEMTDELKILKNGDSLEWVRIEDGKPIVNRELIVSRQFDGWKTPVDLLVAISRELFSRTKVEDIAAQAAFDGVIRAAVEMGLVNRQ